MKRQFPCHFRRPCKVKWDTIRATIVSEGLPLLLLPLGHQFLAIDKHRRGGRALDTGAGATGDVGDITAAIATWHRWERGEAAGGHKEVHHRVVEHGWMGGKRAGQFVLMMVMVVAGSSRAAAIASTAARAARRAAIWVSVGIWRRQQWLVTSQLHLWALFLPLKKSAKGELTPKNSRNTSSGGRNTNGKPPIISKSSKSWVL